MRLGIVQEKNKEKCLQILNKIQNSCDIYYYFQGKVIMNDEFDLFLKENKVTEVVVGRIEDLNLTIIQVNNLMNYFAENEIDFSILDMDMNYLRQLGKNEKKMIRDRTTNGIEIARRKGKVLGRPTIDKEKIERISILYHVHKKTYRQISSELNISVATVYKYANERI